MSNPEKEFFYAQRAEALGVRERKDNQHTPNGASSPSQEDHADALGVGHRTVNRWENTRKEIKADPVLSQKATTPEGYQEAKREVQKRRKATQGEEKRIRNMKDRAASTDSEAERIAVQKKLDKYRDEGVDVDAVMDQKEEDQEREGYFREKQNREGIALRLATKLIEQGNTRVIKSLVLSAFPSEAQLLQAERDYT